jgi:pSer/pThr/pTyr-binding forkhead associated (FHA) protein
MGRVFPINKEIMTIGRDPGNDIVIPGDLKIAPYHIRLLQKNN